MTDRELFRQALEALELLAKYENPLTRIQVRKPRDGGPIVTMYPHKVATDAAAPLRERLAREEPVDSDEKAGAYMDAKLWEFIDMAAAWPKAKPDPRTWDHVLVYAPKPARQEQEPVAHSIVAGALFDFMGWLTSRKERLVLSSTDDAAPAADAIKNFAQMRSLSIADAWVQEWQEHLAAPQREWVGLTEGEIVQIAATPAAIPGSYVHSFALAIEAKLKEKNK